MIDLPMPFRLTAIIIVALLSLGRGEAADSIRVGVYDNPPKVFIGPDGRPQGIFIDVLEHIAEAEGWTLEYHAMPWADAYAAVQTGGIDILVDVALTPERERELRFTSVRVLDSWLDCFAPRAIGPLNLTDLTGRKVAVLTGSVQENYAKTLATMPEFSGEPIILVSCPTYAEVAQAVLDGRADLLLASRFYAFSPQRPPALEAKHIVLQPGGLHFAMPLGDPRQLGADLDRHLANLKNDPSSPYYRSLRNWLDVQPTTKIPAWLVPTLATLLAAVLLFALWTVTLRRQVRAQTVQLAARNHELEQINISLDTALAETRRAVGEEQRALHRLAIAQRLEALGRVTGGVIHDFRNVLTVVTASVDLALASAPEQENLLRHLHRTRDAAERASALISQLLAFAKHQPSAIEVCELNAALRERSAMLDLLVGAEIDLAWDIAAIELPVRFGLSQLDQVLLNLLGNARDAITGRGTITIRSARLDRAPEEGVGATIMPGPYAELRIADTGIGIAAENLSRILEPFYTTKGERGGTGLGLATVISLLTAADGRLHIVSTPGQGTTVRVFLPLAL